MLKMDSKKYSRKVLEFLSSEIAGKFQENSEKAEKIITKIIKEKISNFGELAEMEKEGSFDYYFSAPDVESERLIFKDGTLEDSQKYLVGVVEKISTISESDWNAENIKNIL